MSIVALLGNGFIIVVNGYSWLQSRKLIPCGLLLTCLSLSRFLMQGLLMTNRYLYLSSPGTYEFSCTEQIINMAWNYCNMASFSSDTTLNVFYCLKITTFAHPPFPWLKSRIDKLVPQLLAIPCIAYVLLSLPSYIAYVKAGQCNVLTANGTEWRNPKTNEVFKFLAPAQFTLPALCFAVCLAASILLFVSLWRHTRNLKRNGLDMKDLSTQAHLNVMRSLLCFLVFFVVYFVVLNVTFAHDFRFDSSGELITIILISSYPSAHSIILIVTNPKLKEMCVRILNIVKRFSCSSSSGSAE
ncbi:taste receptor type 2 member 7-like [Heteronotia binoei]|uniref:taste receptor type 2 member 7-like n=1 Tax=Heteronotia binoei TaxID=13085 RepID=UPI00292F9E24|nr:taste receptor type 2 member 7-like [Heteronotia binoei]